MPTYALYNVAPQDLYEGSTPYKFSYGMTVNIGEKSFNEYMHTSEQQDDAVQWIPDTVVMNGTQRWFPGTRTIDGNTIFVHFIDLTITHWFEHSSGQFVQQATCAIMIREP